MHLRVVVETLDLTLTTENFFSTLNLLGCRSVVGQADSEQLQPLEPLEPAMELLERPQSILILGSGTIMPTPFFPDSREELWSLFLVSPLQTPACSQRQPLNVFIACLPLSPK